MGQYKVEFLPQDLVVTRGKDGFQNAISAIQRIINEYASEGWELDQIAQISVGEKPGCLAGLFGAKTVYANYNMVVFRR